VGCGGHVVALRRLAVGEFRVETAVSLDRLTADNWRDYLLAGDAAVNHLPRLLLNDEESKALQQGKRLPRQPEQPTAALVAAYEVDGRFVGVVTADDEYWRPKKIIYSP
jgi:tRNA pseudouridine55 synthase